MKRAFVELKEGDIIKDGDGYFRNGIFFLATLSIGTKSEDNSWMRPIHLAERGEVLYRKVFQSENGQFRYEPVEVEVPDFVTLYDATADAKAESANLREELARLREEVKDLEEKLYHEEQESGSLREHFVGRVPKRYAELQSEIVNLKEENENLKKSQDPFLEKKLLREQVKSLQFGNKSIVLELKQKEKEIHDLKSQSNPLEWIPYVFGKEFDSKRSVAKLISGSLVIVNIETMPYNDIVWTQIKEIFPIPDDPAPAADECLEEFVKYFGAHPGFKHEMEGAWHWAKSCWVAQHAAQKGKGTL